MKYKNFNGENSLIVVTSYPDPENGIRDLNAVAWHAQKTLRAFAKTKKIIVIAEKTGRQSHYLEGKNIAVHRVWKKNSPLSIFTILNWCIKYSTVKNVFFQFEFNIFGGTVPVLMLPLLLMLLKIANKKIFFEMHQVLFDIKTLEKHVNVTNVFMQKMFNAGLWYLYKSIGVFSQAIIVFEQELKNRLAAIVNQNKITVLPIAVTGKKTIQKNAAKKMLGYGEKDFVILMFGFVNWYKGSDLIAKIFTKNKHKNIKLLLAGGPNPTLKNKAYYEKYYRDIKYLADKNSGIKLTGFVPDEEVYKYFSAADVVIFPYRVFMSASGPFSLALSYKKPVLISEKLSHYRHSEDFQSVMNEMNLQHKDIFFNLDSGNVLNRLKFLSANKKALAKLNKFTSLLAQLRSMNQISKQYMNIFSAKAATRPSSNSLFRPIFTVGKLHRLKQVE